MADAATLVIVKRYLKVTGSDDDTLIGELIDGVEGMIEDYVGWELFTVEASYTEYQNGMGENRLTLKRWPASAITTLHDDLERIYGDDTLISSDDYTLHTDSGIIQLDGSLILSTGNLNVKIVYTAGYATLPPAALLARSMEVARFYHRQQQGGDGITQERQGSYSVSWEKEALSKKTKLILARYRTPLHLAR